MFKQIQDSTYYISEQGKIYNRKTKRFLKGSLDKNGYLRFKLNGKNVSIHRMVLETFKPIENMNLLEVNHKDGNKLNNHLDNLEWVTHRQNMEHTIHIKLSEKCSNKGIKNGNSKLTEEQVRNIRKDKRIYSEIAKDYGIVKSTVSAIKNYKLWSEVK